MRHKRVLTTAALILGLALAGLAWGLTDYVGYSGAPGSLGSCAVTCHGSGTGGIWVTGFPAEYVPGQVYEIAVGHHAGLAIANFNCSVRDTPAGNPAGTLAPGTNTEVYSVPEEPLGIHFTNRDQDAGTFTWIAPDPGIGEIKLYLAGLQGGMGGLNTSIMLTAAQQGIGVAEGSLTQPAVSLRLQTRIVHDCLVLQVNIPEGSRPRLRVLNQFGARVAEIPVSAGSGPQTLIWQPVDQRGASLAPGSYFVSLLADGRRQIRKFLVIE